MIGASIVPDIDALVAIQKEFTRRAEQMLLDESDQAAKETLDGIRTEMERAGLGRLGNGLGYTSDKKKGRGVYRRGGQVSASGIVFIRSGSDRTRGAIESYTDGAVIRSRKGRFMWIATDDIPAKAGRYRMTPELYRKAGFETRIGPLVPAKSASGTPLLIVRKVGVNAAGAARSARSLTKRGLPRKGQTEVEFIIAFFGITETTRKGRVNPRAIAADRAQHMARRLGTGMRTQVT